MKKYALGFTTTSLLFYATVVVLMLQTGAIAKGDCILYHIYYIMNSASNSEYDSETNSDGEIGGCAFAGDQPGTVNCQAQGGSSLAINWEITGAITVR